MIELGFIALGGALGAVLRFITVMGTHQLLGRSFPYGTLVVNVVGSLIVGIVTVMLFERYNVSGNFRAFLIIGVLGAFTTFSTFSIETLTLFMDGNVIKSMTNILANILCCLLAVWLGTAIGKLI
ncbi:MAG: fluoride efflux transporter CrcB [Legionellales bacterium]|nr:fluoride efflux transporter CrcB [Legionellales bacterium]|tara:strand:+ start:7731 stop:8105 length:375 start_codon:yes stop_codon:yes gene_type:complete